MVILAESELENWGTLGLDAARLNHYTTTTICDIWVWECSLGYIVISKIPWAIIIAFCALLLPEPIKHHETYVLVTSEKQN